MTETHPVTAATFVAYILGVFILAGLSHRLLSGRTFLDEYYLGSRGLRSWSLAFAFAATATSGGSFIGFPALIYSYGWVLAFWISSYMIYPLCAMGVLGKRLNQVARKTGAITVPDVLRDRFASPTLGIFTSLTILLFTTCNLVAQFKAGAIILEETFNLPESWGYLAGLLVFASVVVLYTTYGGFRAVVWTDVMQGVVMGIGVVILVPVVLSQAGGLGGVVARLQGHPDYVVTSLPGPHNDLAFLRTDEAGGEIEGVRYRKGSANLHISVQTTPDGQILDVRLPANGVTAGQLKRILEEDPVWSRLVRPEFAYENDGSGELVPMEAIYFMEAEEYLFGPGRRRDGRPFHPLGLAISYFVMWAITSMGQPGMMVRLMAFRDSRTLRRAIIIVSFYFALIYIPLVLIFTSARILLPYIPQEGADKAMVLVATRVVGSLGLGYAILAAVFVAAPFAAVMSTVDSFLLLISSSIVRDIYQKTINPSVSQQATRWLSYGTTVTVGIVVTLLAARQIDFLQYIVVFTSSGFAATFLAPMFLGIFWSRMTRSGALASAMGGLGSIILFFLPTLWGFDRVNLFGFHPVIWGLFVSFFLGIVVSLVDGEPEPELVKRYFERSSDQKRSG